MESSQRRLQVRADQPPRSLGPIGDGNAGDYAVISGPISGAGGITKTGRGRLDLTGTSSYTTFKNPLGSGTFSVSDNYNSLCLNVTPATVPEPGTLTLLAMALLSLPACARRLLWRRSRADFPSWLAASRCASGKLCDRGNGGLLCRRSRTPFSTLSIVSELTGGYTLLLPSLPAELSCQLDHFCTVSDVIQI